MKEEIGRIEGMTDMDHRHRGRADAHHRHRTRESEEWIEKQRTTGSNNRSNIVEMDKDMGMLRRWRSEPRPRLLIGLQWKLWLQYKQPHRQLW